MAGILVFAEMEDNEALHPNFWELMAACQQVQNEVEGGLQVVVQGHELGSLDDLKKCGANQIYQVEDPKLAELWPDAHLAALVCAVSTEMESLMSSGLNDLNVAPFCAVQQPLASRQRTC